jgi:hypothetical protein
MRIIDRHRDYYDYLQTYDDDVVYDRRGSIIIKNETILEYLSLYQNFYNKKDVTCLYLVLRIGYTNWLLKTIPTKIDYSSTYKVVDYNLELLDSWKDYNHSYEPEFGFVETNFQMLWKEQKHIVEEIKRGFEYRKIFNEEKGKLKPFILKELKITSLIKPEALYNAYDEYFHHLKDDVDYDTMTNEEKIISHGFDTKVSFRGKQ